MASLSSLQVLAVMVWILELLWASINILVSQQKDGKTFIDSSQKRFKPTSWIAAKVQSKTSLQKECNNLIFYLLNYPAFWGRFNSLWQPDPSSHKLCGSCRKWQSPCLECQLVAEQDFLLLLTSSPLNFLTGFANCKQHISKPPGQLNATALDTEQTLCRSIYESFAILFHTVFDSGIKSACLHRYLCFSHYCATWEWAEWSDN